MAAAKAQCIEHESVSLRHLWRFLGFSLPYWGWLAGGVVTGLVRMALGLFMPWYLKYVIDDVGRPFADGRITTAEAWSRLGGISLLLGGIMAVHCVATLGRFYFPHRAAASAIRDVRFKLFRHLQRLSLGFHARRPTGTIVARVIADVEAASRRSTWSSCNCRSRFSRRGRSWGSCSGSTGSGRWWRWPARRCSW